MSGGVDSSVALLLLKQQGYTVAGATMKLWEYDAVGGAGDRPGGCCDLNAINNARAVCEAVGVPHYVFDFSERFHRTVIANFVSEYRAGRTPNPCVVCNSEIKWEIFLERALQIDCDAIATGHYARVGFDSSTGRYAIRKGIDATRDQSYALWGIRQPALARTVLPVGALTKVEVRRIAAEAGLKTAQAAESMEICFVTDNDYGRFIREWSGDDIPAGEIVDRSGMVLGRHRGIPFYTIGQRKGLGIAHPTPLHVLRIDPGHNRLIVGDKSDLNREEMTVGEINWVSRPPAERPFSCEVKIRYQHRAGPAEVTPQADGRLLVRFALAQPAITPGQSAVFYDDDIVLAGGIIE